MRFNGNLDAYTSTVLGIGSKETADAARAKAGSKQNQVDKHV